MAMLPPSRTVNLSDHLDLGSAWIDESERGKNTTALSYASFEFRLAIERLALQIWLRLLQRKPESDDMKDIRRFKNIERRIYQLAGHQREINGHFEFMRIVLSLGKIPVNVTAPNIQKLAGYWHECSELCHISGALALAHESNFGTTVFNRLQIIRAFLYEQVNAFSGWPIIHDRNFLALRDRFIAGDATSDDIRAYLEKTGFWAKVQHDNGRPSEFVGEAIPPNEEDGR